MVGENLSNRLMLRERDRRVEVSFPARRNCKCKGHEARACLVCSMNSKEARVGSKGGKGRVSVHTMKRVVGPGELSELRSC